MEQVEHHFHNGVDSPQVKEADLAGAYDGSTAVKLTGDQTVAGVKTFTSIPILPASDPTTDNQAVRKAYVDARFAETEIYASDTPRDIAGNDTTADYSSYTKIKEIQYNELSATIRTYLEGWAATAKLKIYINGVAAGTERTATGANPDIWIEDLAVETGDLVQVYAYKPGGGSVTLCTDFELRYDKRFTITAGTIISN
jgi:hypothetical protein